MPIMPKRSLVPCGENVPPFEERPIRMPKQPRDCRGCYGCTGWCTISFGSILPPEKFPLSLWASSRDVCLCRKFSVVSLNCRDEVLSAEDHKIRASQGTKVPCLSSGYRKEDDRLTAVCIARLVAC